MKGMSYNKWKKIHKNCYHKEIEAEDHDKKIKAVHCLNHNELFILDIN